MLRLLFCLFAFSISATNFCQSNRYSNIYFNEIKNELTDQWVSSITQDLNGFMWFATQDGLYKYNGKNFNAFRYNPQDSTSLPANWVRSVTQDAEGVFWLGTQGSGLIRFEEDLGVFERINSDENDPFNPTIVYEVFATSSLDLWVNTDKALFRRSHLGNGFKKVYKQATRIQILELENKQEILIIDDGLYRYDPKNNEIHLLLDKIAFGRALTSGNTIFYRSEGKLFKYNLDQELPIQIPAPNNDLLLSMSNHYDGKCLLFGKESIYIFDTKSSQYELYESDIKNIRARGINEIYIDSQNLLWIATTKGVFKESKLAQAFNGSIDLHARRILVDSSSLIVGGAAGLFRIAKDDIDNPIRLSEYNQITAMLKTDSGIWVGDYYGHLFFVDNNDKVIDYQLRVNGRIPFKIYGIVKDANKRLWVSSWDGIYVLDEEGEVLAKFELNETGENVKVVKLLIDREDNLWAITIGDGLFKMDNISEVDVAANTFKYKQYKNEKGNSRSINANVVMELHQNESNELWFGSDFGINLYHKETDDFSPLTVDDKLFDKKVMAIETDPNGLMWISTISDGVYIYDREKDKIFNLKEQDGFLSNACLFTSSSVFENELYFGTDEGIQQINTANYDYPIITQKPTFRDMTFVGNSALPIAIYSEMNAIEIKHDQNNFNIHLEIADYRFPDKVNYYYKLKNNDQYWTKVEDNIIHLNSLNYGYYNLQAKAAYQASDEAPIASLAFTISPPWYKSVIAYVVLFCLLSGLIFYFFQLRYRQKLANRKLKAVEELDAFKSKLFTNISHELRTPLTLISGPLENQLSKKNLNPSDRTELGLARQNATRLLNLVNQMLDLSMVDSGEVKLNIEHGNLAMLLKQIIEAFQYEARKKNIHIDCEIDGLISAWYDADCIEKIVTNLLSNAIKYAPTEGDISINARQQDDNLSLSIVNTSENFTEENVGQLFQRFYQNDSSSEGIGVGLALVKELVNLSQGNIIANTISNNRIQFSVTLPIQQKAFSEEVMEGTTEDSNAIDLDSELKRAQAKDNVILIVEDNDEIREFVNSIFKEDYTILLAENGEKGVQLALEHIPDLIISDIMMPIMDGIELCNELKFNELTSHIPIILLTAKQGNKSEIEGLKTGADAYITKPFSVEKVKVRVHQLIENRLKLQKYYSESFTINPELAISSTESDFLKRLQKTLDDNITNNSFTSERFSELMLMSRTQLHRKLRASFDMSATEFIRSQRLKLGAKLLRESDATTSEIGYQIGFNSLSYFSKCFKEIYGCSPSEYRLDQ